MALKKSDLRAILKNEDSSNEEKVSEILDMLHNEVDAVKDAKDDLQSKLDEAEDKIKDLEKASTKDTNEWKSKYEKEHSDFEAYKTEQTEKATKDAQKKAYIELLKEAGVSEKTVNLIANTKEADVVISGIKFGEDGKVVESDNITNKIKADYKDFIQSKSSKGASTPNPSSSEGGKLTKAQIYATDEKGRYKLSTQERLKALAEQNEE